MTKASITGPGGGEVIHLGPAPMRILEDGSTTGHRLGMGEITVAPHTDGPPQHRHARHDEGFYVVSGHRPVHRRCRELRRARRHAWP